MGRFPGLPKSVLETVRGVLPKGNFLAERYQRRGDRGFSIAKLNLCGAGPTRRFLLTKERCIYPGGVEG